MASAQHDEQHEALQRRLVELARVARLRAAVRERPWPRARRVARPQSSPLMKLARRPRNRPIGATAAGDVGQATGSGSLRQRASRIRATRAAEQAAMERHAAVPDREDLARVLDEEVEIVEEDVAEPPAEHDAERGIDEQVVEDLGRRAWPSAPEASVCGRAGAHRTSRRAARRHRPARTSGWRRARPAAGRGRSSGTGSRAPEERQASEASVLRRVRAAVAGSNGALSVRR